MKQASPAPRTCAACGPAATRTAPRAPQAVTVVDNQFALRSAIPGRIQARGETASNDDPLEHEADRVADRISAGRRAAAPPADCPTCRDRIFRKEGGARAPGARPPVIGSVGGNLDAATRGGMESRFGQDFSSVRIHTGARAEASAASLGARAYTLGEDIVFGRSQYRPGTTTGNWLLAHELTHVVQQRGAAGNRIVQRDDTPATPEDISVVADRAVAAVQANDVAGAVSELRRREIWQLQFMNFRVHEATGTWLHTWFAHREHNASLLQTAARWSPGTLLVVAALAPHLDVARRAAREIVQAVDTATPEEGLRALWPSLSLLDRLELFEEGAREIEQAQLDAIRHATQAEREEANSDTVRRNRIYENMDPKEEYDARLLLAPGEPRVAVEKLCDRAHGIVSDRDDDVFSAFLALTPDDRRTAWNNKSKVIRLFLWDREYSRLERLATGTEDDAVMARLEFATEWRRDDTAGITASVESAAALLTEQRRLRLELDNAALTDEERTTKRTRLAALDAMNLDRFSTIPTGGATSDSFMGRLIAAGSGDEFAGWARTLGVDPIAIARQRILMADNLMSVDTAAIQRALRELHAPPVEHHEGESDTALEARQTQADNAVRATLIAERPIQRILDRLSATVSERAERDSIVRLTTGDRFDELWHTDFFDAVSNGSWGEVYRLTLMFCSRADWHARLQEQVDEARGASGAMALMSRLPAAQRAIFDRILTSGTPPAVPLDLLLDSTGSVDTLREILSSLGETQRGQLRRGYWLARHGRQLADLVGDDHDAFVAFNDFERHLRASQSTGTENHFVVDEGGIQDLLDAVLGTTPTAAENDTPEGRFRAAEILYERERARLALDRGLVTPVTETDETMEAAALQFAAAFERFRPAGAISAIDFAALAALHETFMQRAGEFTDASNQISEVASMVASAAAAMLVVAATGGAATPAVIAMAAAAGAGSRVLTREMFGGDYYNPASAAGGRDLALGALDGALAVLGSALAARAVEAVGLGGRALTSAAARFGGQAAEHASETLSRRVAAGAVEAAIDGAFSGSVSEAAGAILDARSWRDGIWQGLVRVGQSALVGGLTGLATGGVIGGALPLAGRGIRWVMDAAMAASIERSVADAAMSEVLAEARAAARAGHVDDANRLFRQLQTALSPRQTQALWREMAGDFEAALVRLEGTAAPASADQARLLASSKHVELGSSLSPEQLAAETDVVRRSSPRATTEPGYVDEVPLGEGHHTWRRREDGTWCRFSLKDLCGTVIPGMEPPRSHLPLDRGPPTTYRTRRFTDINQLPRDSARNFEPLPDGVIYEFGDGSRVWREGGGIRHDTTLRRGGGRSATEGEMFTAGERGDGRYAGMERAHTLGQGTGFESPFGIYYAPREVNQIIQNNGIEEFMRGLRDTARPGETFHVSTLTTAHPNSLRLKEIHYRVEVTRPGGQREVLFEYGINVGSGTPPSITHGVTFVTPDANLHNIFDRVDLPSRLRARFATVGGTGPAPRAANWDAVQSVLDRPVASVTLPPNYVRYQRTDGRWVIERSFADSAALQRLTVRTRDDGVQVIALWAP